MDNQLKRQAHFDLRYGEGAASRLIEAPYMGKTVQSIADDLSISRQYVSTVYVQLTGRTWASVLHEKGFNIRGRRSGNHHPETV